MKKNIAVVTPKITFVIVLKWGYNVGKYSVDSEKMTKMKIKNQLQFKPTSIPNILNNLIFLLNIRNLPLVMFFKYDVFRKLSFS